MVPASLGEGPEGVVTAVADLLARAVEFGEDVRALVARGAPAADLEVALVMIGTTLREMRQLASTLGVDADALAGAFQLGRDAEARAARKRAPRRQSCERALKAV